jgi:hypothetical protein
MRSEMSNLPTLPNGVTLAEQSMKQETKDG